MVSVSLKGGEKFRKKLEEISGNLNNGGALKVGFLSNARYASGTPVAQIAAIQNFGAPAKGIPPRPFFSNMIKDKSDGWPKGIATQLKETNYDVDATLNRTGQAIAGQLRQAIVDTNEPPLSQVTLMLRKMRTENPDLVVTAKTVGQAAARIAAGESPGGVSTKPLVDIGPEGGHMLQSVDYSIDRK